MPEDSGTNTGYMYNNSKSSVFIIAQRKKTIQGKTRLTSVVYSQSEMLCSSRNEWTTVAFNMSES